MSFRIRILPVKPGQLNNWRIFLSLHTGTVGRNLKHFEDFLVNMYVIKDQLDHFEETFAQIIQSSLSKRPESDPIQFFRIRIHNTVNSFTVSCYHRKP
jgi:hypothetical protein